MDDHIDVDTVRSDGQSRSKRSSNGSPSRVTDAVTTTQLAHTSSPTRWEMSWLEAISLDDRSVIKEGL